MLLKLLAAPSLAGVEQHVIAMLPGGGLASAMRATGARVDEVDLLGGWPLLGGTARLVRLARDAAPDLVQGWMYHGNLGALLAQRVQPRRVPLVWGVRQTLATLEGENAWARAAIHLNRMLSGRPDCVVFNSRTSIEQHRRFGFADRDLRFVRNGFDGSRFRPDATARAASRAAWGFDAGHVVFGMVARLHPVKGHADFLRAGAALLRSRPQARLVVVGPGPDEERAALVALAGELGIAHALRIEGDRRDVPAVLAGLDVFVSASTAEAFSNAIGEALCSALPCVATAVGESPALVADGGRVVRPSDPQALAQAMIELCDVGADERAAIGLRARARTLREFGIEAVAAEFDALWRGLARGDRRAAIAAG